MQLLYRLFFCVCSIFVFAGCDSAISLTGNVPSENTERAGITNTSVRLGASLALTGHASFLGKQNLQGAMSYLKRINDAGGVHGRKIILDARDDGYDPPRCLANTQQFLIDGNVFALFGYVGTPTTVRILPLVEEAQIPLLGMFTGANALRQPFSPWLINVRASYYQETRAAIRYLVKTLGLNRIAVFYQYDAYGFDGLIGAELALRELNLAPVARGSYMRGSSNVREGVKRISAANAQAVVMVGTYEPCAMFIRRAEQLGMQAIFYNLSFVGGEELARRLGSTTKNPVLFSHVVPPLQGEDFRVSTGVVAEYLHDLATYFPDSPPNSVGLEGYVNARVFVEGLRRAGPDLTRKKFIRAIETMRQFSLGGMTVTFGPRDHQGMDTVYFSVLHHGRFALLTDAAAVRSMQRLRQKGGEQ